MDITVNIGELKNHLSEYLERVESGGTIAICKRNVPIATIAGISQKKNSSQPGWARSSLRILDSIEGPAIPASDGQMFEENPASQP